MNHFSFLLQKNYLILCAVNFITNMGQFMMNTLLPKYADSLGATTVMIGFVTSAFSITALLIKPVSGPAIDSFPKRKLLIGGMAILLIAFLGYSVSTSVSMLITFRLLHGISTGITVITCLSMISEVVPRQQLPLGIAYYSTLQALATAVGPSTGLFLQQHFGYRIAFWAAAAMIGVVVLAMLSWHIQETTPRQPFFISLDRIFAAQAAAPALVMLFLAAVYVTISSFLVLYAEQKGIDGIGTFFTVYAVVLFVGRPITGKLAVRFGTVPVMVAAILFFASGMWLISCADSLPGFLLAAACVALGYGTCQPLVQTMCIQSAPSNRRGAASATCYYGTDLGYILSPIFSSFLEKKYGYALMFRGMILLLVVAIAILLISWRTRQHSAA